MLKQYPKDGIEIVFVSHDQDVHQFETYYDTQPWKALPYDRRDNIEYLTAKYEIRGIPSLIIIEAINGKLVDKYGRQTGSTHYIKELFTLFKVLYEVEKLPTIVHVLYCILFYIIAFFLLNFILRA